MKKVIAFVVAMVLIMAPLSLAFADDELVMPDMMPADQMWQNAGCYMLWLLLQAYGIMVGDGLYPVSPEDVVEWSDEVYNNMTQLVLEFLDELPSPMSINYWVSPWWWGSDFWGQFKYNASMLEDAEDFANWLITKFNLVDNDTVNANGVPMIDGLICYQPTLTMSLEGSPSWDAGTTPGQYTQTRMEITSSYDPVYAVFWHYEGNKIYPELFSASPFKFKIITYYTNGNVAYQQTFNVNSTKIGNWYSLLHSDGSGGQVFSYINSAYNPFVYYSKQTVIDALASDVILSGGIQIGTTAIDLPSDNPNYTEGDGVVIIDGEPNYQPVVVVNDISVSNLPAVISPSGTQDPGFSQAFLPIRAFVNTFHDSMDIMRDIIYRLPSQVVTVFMFIFGVTAIFGALHMFKEH